MNALCCSAGSESEAPPRVWPLRLASWLAVATLTLRIFAPCVAMGLGSGNSLDALIASSMCLSTSRAPGAPGAPRDPSSDSMGACHASPNNRRLVIR